MAEWSRRQFLTLPLVLACALPPRSWGGGRLSHHGYTVEVGILYDLFRFATRGSIEEYLDPLGGVYEVAVVGDGPGLETRVESTGRWRDERWAPTRYRSRFVVRQRESWTEITFDHERRLVGYRARSETFFLGRERRVSDTLALPVGVRVDDLISAVLNFRDNLWSPDRTGAYRTHIVRRQQRRGEGPDDVDRSGYRAELVELAFRPEGATAVIDLSRFSSWALEDSPARVTFGSDRYPEHVSAGLILGTRLEIHFTRSLAPTS